MSQHEEGQSQAGTEEGDKDRGQLVPVVQAEREVLKREENPALLNNFHHSGAATAII